MLEGVVKELCRGKVAAKVITEYYMFLYGVATIIDIVNIALIDFVLSEVTQPEREVDAIASNCTAKRRDNLVEVEVVGQRSKTIGVAHGIVVFVQVTLNIGEGANVKSVGEVAGDDKRVGEFVLDIATRRNAQGAGGLHGEVGAVGTVADDEIAYGVITIVVDYNTRIDGLTELGVGRVGNFRHTHIHVTTGTADPEVVDGCTISEIGGR